MKRKFFGIENATINEIVSRINSKKYIVNLFPVRK